MDATYGKDPAFVKFASAAARDPKNGPIFTAVACEKSRYHGDTPGGAQGIINAVNEAKPPAPIGPIDSSDDVAYANRNPAIMISTACDHGNIVENQLPAALNKRRLQGREF